MGAPHSLQVPSGKAIIQSSADTKAPHLKLGGNDARIVLPHADPKAIT